MCSVCFKCLKFKIIDFHVYEPHRLMQQFIRVMSHIKLAEEYTRTNVKGANLK